ncbi:MAG TPA: PQQ-binding-like beta-propeller repeat protein [Gemmataceae bacterium]|nr:PQQ-binding-like beta-propeller repeat protein [Gemmataceae bacterium]
MTRRYWLSSLVLSLVAGLGLDGTAVAGDWIHWRGPEETGHARDTGLPDTWDPFQAGKNNLIWKVPLGYRSTPIIMGDKMYVTAAVGDVPRPQSETEKLHTAERVVCMNTKDGSVVWTRQFNVFLADIVTSRLGWAPLTADPETKKIYAHTSGGFFVCLDGNTGKTIWEHQLTEEFGRVTGYGGRVAGPVCDSGLVIVAIAQGSWGSLARGAGRLVAFDKDTGAIAWWGETPFDLIGTFYSNPVVANLGGQRVIITGSADGGLHAFQVRTGKRVWSYKFGAGVINPSPVVVGNYILCSHGEENPDGGDIGRVICLDGTKIKEGKPEVVWQFSDGTRFGLASPATDGKYLYVPSDGGKLYCFDIFKEPTGGAKKTNKFIWKYNFGTTTRGSPVVADNKIFISEVNAKFVIIKLEGKKAPEKAHVVQFKAPPPPEGEGQVEVNSTPAIANGRVYFGTRDESFCIGTKDGKAGEVPASKNAENPVAAGATPAQIQLFPADIAVKPGDSVEFKLRAYTADGVLIPDAMLKAEWSLPVPVVPKKEASGPPKAKEGTEAKEAPPEKKAEPAPKTAGGPPALDATIDAATGKITVNAKKPAQNGVVMAKVGNLTATARVRVMPQIPYKQDFAMVPVGAVPGGWVNTQGKYTVVEDGGKKVLFKVNTNPRPPVARAYAYITAPNSTGYTIEADIKGVIQKEKLPDAGVMANRYTMYLDGKSDEKGQQSVRVISWEALPRIDVGVPFKYESGVWYRMKLTVEVGEKEAVVKGKVWDRTKPEPEKWTIEYKDPLPNREGAAALYGYVTNAEAGAPGSEIFYDNVVVTPNKK